MKKYLYLNLLVVALVMMSCNKDQQAVKALEGDWLEVSIDGTPVAAGDAGTVHFDYCKLKKDEWCTMSYTDSDGSSTGNYDYKVQDKGEVMVQRIEDSTKGFIELQGNIVELSDEKLILEMSFFGVVTKTEYKKK